MKTTITNRNLGALEPQEGLAEVGRRIHSLGYLAAADGNFSFRVSDQEIWITPTQKHKGYLHSEDMACIRLDGTVVSGHPSGERLMHLEVYRKCADAKAVVHAHPPTAIAWSVAKPALTELPCESLSEVILAVGRIPIIPYQRPGTIEMGSALDPWLPLHRVFILARHGALSWGESLEEAFFGMERLEHSASILWRAEQLGGMTNLPTKEVEYLRELRKKLGNKNL